MLGEYRSYVYKSEKVCKKWYRRLEWLDTRLTINTKDKQALLSLYRTNKENKRESDGCFKRQSKDGLTADIHNKQQSLLKPRTMCFDVEMGVNETVDVGSSLNGCGGDNQSYLYEENLSVFNNKPAKTTV